MERIRSSVFILTILTNGCVLAGGGWMPSFEEAEQAAARQQIPLLMHFHAFWCRPCRQMGRQLFSSPDVQRALQDGLAAVKVDITDRPDLKERFAAVSIPRDVVVYPDGSVETLSVGMVRKSLYLSILRDAAARGRSISMTLMEQLESAETGKTTHAVESVPAASSGSTDEEIIGLSGYCPVSLMRRKQWVRGNPNLAERYRGVLYYLRGDKQRDEFLRNPDRYAPCNLGCDPVVLFREQRAVTGRIRYGAFFDGKLYLFRTAESRREFRFQPLRYTRIQHAVRSGELTGQTFR